MNSAVSVNTRGVKIVALMATLAACCFAFMALSANQAKASTPGAPIHFEFNYVGLNIGTTIAGEVDQLVLTPDSTVGEPPIPLPPLTIDGTYNDANGNFTVQNAGFQFPDINVSIDVATVDGSISLAEAAQGNYNAATGAMTFNPKIKLTLGTSDVSVLPIPGLGSGPLSCEFSPLSLSLSTAGTWPHDGSAFADKANIKDGSISGAFTQLPDVKTLAGGPTLCPIIAGLISPVGGLWLGQSDAPLAGMPTGSGTKPEPTVDPPDCVPPQTGTPGNCVDPPPVVEDPANIKSSTAPSSVKIKKGKSGVVKVVVKNSGDLSATGVKVCATISKKFAKAPACSKSATVAGGASKTVPLTFKLSKKAKGSKTATVTISSSAGKVVKKVKITAKK